MKNFFKRAREKCFKRMSLSQAILLIAVLVMIVFKFKSNPASIQRFPLNVDLQRLDDVVVPDPDKVNPLLKESHEPKYMRE